MRSLSKSDAIIYFLVITSVLLGIVMRVNGYLGDSFWYDEVASFELAHYSLNDLFAGIMARDSHPPLFLLIAKLWLLVTGPSETAARALTVIMGILSTGAIFYMALVYSGKRAAAFATVIASFHHLVIAHSQEFRSYILLFMLSALSLALCSKWFLGKTAKKRDLLLLIIVNIMLIYTHYYALIIVLLENIIFLSIVHGDIDRRMNLRWWQIQAVVFTSFALWLPGLAFHAFHLSQGHLSSNINFHQLFFYFSPFVGSHKVGDPTSIVGVIPFIFVALYALSIPKPEVFRNLLGKIKSVFKKRTGSKDNLRTYLLIFIFFVISNLLILASGSLFPKNLTSVPFEWKIHLREALILNAVAFLLIFLGAFINLRAANAGGQRQLNRDTVAKIVFGALPLFALIIIYLSGLFSDNYQTKNLFIILPSFICAVALSLSRIKRDLIFVLVLVIFFATSLSQAYNVQKVYTRWGYRTISKAIVRISDKLNKKIPVLTISHEAKLCLKHYLKDYEVVDCRKSDCDGIKKNNDLIFWVWHGFNLPSEKGHEDMLKSELKDHPLLFDASSNSLNCALLRYSD